MFDFLKSDGGDKKQELEENIEQIRQKVQQEQAGAGAADTRRSVSPAAGNQSEQQFADQDTYDDTPEQESARNDDFTPDEPEEPEPPVQDGSPVSPQQQDMEEQSFDPRDAVEQPAERNQQERNESTADTEQDSPAERDFERSGQAAAAEQEYDDYDYQRENPQNMDAQENNYSSNQSSASERQQGRRSRSRRQANARTNQANTRTSTRASESAREQIGQAASRDSRNTRTQETRDTTSADTAESSSPREELEQEIPEPPEVKDLDIPDIERGPLFITVSKFKNALGTLADMKHISAQMEEQVGELEETLEHDRKTEDQLRQVLEKTIDDTEVIQNVVSPKERESSE